MNIGNAISKINTVVSVAKLLGSVPMRRPDIYITEIDTGSRIGLAMLPEQVEVHSGAKFQNYDIISLGEIRIPKGTQLDSFSWKGTLPGAIRQGLPFLKAAHWQEPKEIEGIWKKWKNGGTKLKLMITGTSINSDVYLKNFSIEHAKGAGDYQYDISFITAKDLMVFTTKELGLDGNTPERPSAGGGGPYVVKDGDSLWAISEQKLGDGSRWSEVYDLNKDQISDPDSIYPGQSLTMPGG